MEIGVLNRLGQRSYKITTFESDDPKSGDVESHGRKFDRELESDNPKLDSQNRFTLES